MNLPNFNIRQMLEAGVHFGHRPTDGIHQWTSIFMGQEMGSHIGSNANFDYAKSALAEIHKLVSRRQYFICRYKKASATTNS